MCSPLPWSPCCGNPGFWSALWLVLTMLLGALYSTVCSVTSALHLTGFRRRHSQHLHACLAAVPDLWLLVCSGVIEAVCGPAASAATLAVHAASASEGVATRDDRRAASGASVSGARRCTRTMSGVAHWDVQTHCSCTLLGISPALNSASERSIVVALPLTAGCYQQKFDLSIVLLRLRQHATVMLLSPAAHSSVQNRHQPCSLHGTSAVVCVSTLIPLTA